MDKPAKKTRKREREIEDELPTAETFEEFKTLFPLYEFREHKGKIQRPAGSKDWVTVCKHNRNHKTCTLCGDGAFICEHKHLKYTCKDCKGTQICRHNIKKFTCRECNPKLNCIHNKRKSGCKECRGSDRCKPHNRMKTNCKDCGGSQICEHGIGRRLCRDCDGKGLCEHKNNKYLCKICGDTSRCIHGKKRYICRECGGAGICHHDKHKQNCAECHGSNVCIGCNTHRASKDRYCTTCHPDYVPTLKGASKVACKFIDELQIEMNQTIQHRHYNHATKSLIGIEHRPKFWSRKPVDGFIEPNIAIEFLGDFFHGNPKAKKHISNDAFVKTENNMTKLASLGYEVMYIWEGDYYRKEKMVTSRSLLRTFNGKLEWE